MVSNLSELRKVNHLAHLGSHRNPQVQQRVMFDIFEVIWPDLTPFHDSPILHNVKNKNNPNGLCL